MLAELPLRQTVSMVDRKLIGFAPASELIWLTVQFWRSTSACIFRLQSVGFTAAALTPFVIDVAKRMPSVSLLIFAVSRPSSYRPRPPIDPGPAPLTFVLRYLNGA